MALFRGRGGRGRGGRGRGGPATRGTSRPARSGIKTKSGYRKFDSQRVRDVDDSDDEQPPLEEPESEVEGEEELSDEDEEKDSVLAVKSYSALLQSFKQPGDSSERQAKRRKIEEVEKRGPQFEEEEVDHALADSVEEGGKDEEVVAVEEEELNPGDPFEAHFASPDNNDLSRRLKAVQNGSWRVEKGQAGKTFNVTAALPNFVDEPAVRKGDIACIASLHLKERLQRNAKTHVKSLLSSDIERKLAPYLFSYQDIVLGNRTPQNAEALRRIASLHAVNHILKGRDKVLKNNEKLLHAQSPEILDVQDQGYARPKVLLLLETRQMAALYANAIVNVFQPDQQENRKRFEDSFMEPVDESEVMPEDYRELFGGNNDNSFLTALKFTRKTIKFYSAFYNSDIIVASPLGLRRIIENEDARKQDHDFLSSIEVAIIDQADAMQMQNWENVELVLKHLNLQPKESHGADFNRVRSWYLDGNAKYLRQTILFGAYLTPEMNRLYNTTMLNVAGKAKFTPTYTGTITETSGLGIKQTFSRFVSASPLTDPDTRFKYFTTAILPGLLRLPKPADGAQGILVFIPSYYDFLRLRNFFATSAQTENISFGTIHDYSEVSDQRRARSHFSNGRHSILLYTQRAHHFFRLKIRGVKRVVMYGLPDNPIFCQELVEGFLGSSVQEGKIDAIEAGVRVAFGKWDGLRLERVVGSERVKGMLGGVGDTFDFV